MGTAQTVYRVAVLALVAAVLSTGPANPITVAQTDSKQQPANGIYAVLRRGKTADELRPVSRGQQVVEDHRTVTWGEANEARRFILLKSHPDVPLELEGAPQVVTDETGGDRLNLQFGDNTVEKLGQFTTRNLGASAVLIIDGQVVMDAIIRAPITDGRLQLSFCGDSAAKGLMDKLSQPVATDSKSK